MKFADLLHTLVSVTHGSSDDESGTAAHDAVTEFEDRMHDLENAVFGGNVADARRAGDVSRETSPLSPAADNPAGGAGDGTE